METKSTYRHSKVANLIHRPSTRIGQSNEVSVDLRGLQSKKILASREPPSFCGKSPLTVLELAGSLPLVCLGLEQELRGTPWCVVVGHTPFQFQFVFCRTPLKQPVCRNEAGERFSHTHQFIQPASLSTTEKSQKLTPPRLRGEVHPLKGPTTTHHGEKLL